jgi:hypothetical protein
MTTTDNSPQRMPALYFSHGAPPLADDPIWPGQLADLSKNFPKPSAILMISAHWEEAPLTLAATTTVPLVHDFWGFPQRYYQVRCRAPCAPALADSVRKMLHTPGLEVQDAATAEMIATVCVWCSGLAAVVTPSSINRATAPPHRHDRRNCMRVTCAAIPVELLSAVFGCAANSPSSSPLIPTLTRPAAGGAFE